jgi:GntR family transcriptional regulator, transcriptional repressor for pyruvate dehydrogenase complex
MTAAAKRSPFRRVQKATVVEGIIEQLKTLIGTSHYPPNSKFPSERDMAKQLGVSVPSLREALRTLAVMGVIDTRHGSGTRVADSSANVFKVPFEFLLRLDHPTIGELFETRELIEVFLAGHAAQKRTDEDLATMDSAFAEMRACNGDPVASVEPDIRFHLAIAAAARNRVLERMMGCLHDEIRVQMETAAPGVPDVKAMLDYHGEILESIRRGKPDDARRAMKKHMDETAKELKRAEAKRR